MEEPGDDLEGVGDEGGGRVLLGGADGGDLVDLAAEAHEGVVEAQGAAGDGRQAVVGEGALELRQRHLHVHHPVVEGQIVLGGGQ